VVLASVVYTTLGSAIALIRQLAGLAPATAWLNVVIYLALALLYLRMLSPRFDSEPAASPA
jgi:hypothetical protein